MKQHGDGYGAESAGAHASIHEKESVATKAEQSSNPAGLCCEVCVVTCGRPSWNVAALYVESLQPGQSDVTRVPRGNPQCLILTLFLKTR